MEKQGCKLCICEFSKFGFRFQPSDYQICEYYLKSIIKGKIQQLPCNHLITEEKLYEDYSTPWEIFKKDDPRWLVSLESSNNNKKKIKKTIYVFTILKKKGERMIRKAGCGCWTGQNNKDVVNEEGQVIGSNKLLTFEIKDKKMMDHDINSYGKWIMHEYCLKSCDNNYALCKITKEEDVVDEKMRATDYNRQLCQESSNIQINAQVFSDNIGATVTVSDENMQLINQENLDEPVLPLLDGDLGTFVHQLDKTLDVHGEEGAYHGEDVTNNLAVMQQFSKENRPDQAHPQVSVLAMDVSEDRDIVNQHAFPRADEEEYIITSYIKNIYSDSLFQLPDPIIGMPEDMQEFNNVPVDEQVIVEQHHQNDNDLFLEVSDVTQDMQEFINIPEDIQDMQVPDEIQDMQEYFINVPDNQPVLIKQQQSSYEIPSPNFIRHIASNFDYFYNLQQQQQLEEDQHISPGKRRRILL